LLADSLLGFLGGFGFLGRRVDSWTASSHWLKQAKLTEFLTLLSARCVVGFHDLWFVRVLSVVLSYSLDV
jgi:hypothetical protein